MLKVEIPTNVEIRRLSAMTRTGIVGYENEWTDVGTDEPDSAWYNLGKRDETVKQRRRTARSRIYSSSSE
jgi:hypothetical protein